MNFYRIIDHTADLEIIVTGLDIRDLFMNAFSATADLIFDITTLKASVQKHFQFNFTDLKEALVRMLGIIIENVDSRSVLFYKLTYLKISKNTISGKAVGAKIPDDMEPLNVIKAVTYHDLYIDPTGKKARILFDI
ncbi:MAG: archease [Thermoplasmata archaeon]